MNQGVEAVRTGSPHRYKRSCQAWQLLRSKVPHNLSRKPCLQGQWSRILSRNGWMILTYYFLPFLRAVSGALPVLCFQCILSCVRRIIMDISSLYHQRNQQHESTYAHRPQRPTETAAGTTALDANRDGSHAGHYLPERLPLGKRQHLTQSLLSQTPLRALWAAC